MQTIQDLKNNKKLSTEGLSLSKQLSADNMNRTIAYLSLLTLIIAAFFISLANAKFDFSKIFEAQFWIDFSITTGGGLFLKWIFGKYGNYEGHKNKDVVAITKKIEDDNKSIEDKNLLSLYKEYINFNNITRKLKAIRKKVFTKARKKPKKDKWQEEKRCVKLMEERMQLDLTLEEGKKRYDVITEELEDMNFDIEAYNIKYPMIKEDTLRTGFASASSDNEEQLTYSEVWELFGKSSLITLLTISMSILLAVSDMLLDSITLKTFAIFFTRVTLFVINSYVGFTISKKAVEEVKLNVLNNIHSFLKTFLEPATGGKLNHLGVTELTEEQTTQEVVEHV